MTPHAYQSRVKARIEARLQEVAIINGTSSSRTFDELRYNAGICAGLKAAMMILEETLKATDEDNDDGR